VAIIVEHELLPLRVHAIGGRIACLIGPWYKWCTSTSDCCTRRK